MLACGRLGKFFHEFLNFELMPFFFHAIPCKQIWDQNILRSEQMKLNPVDNSVMAFRGGRCGDRPP